MGLKRGDIAIVSAPGDYGKPRPALILQSDRYRALDSVVVALITTHLLDDPAIARKRILPAEGNGLRKESEVMLDKLMSLPRIKISEAIRRLSKVEMAEISSALALLLGL